MNVDHEDRQVTVYKAEITVTLTYEEAVALSEQIYEATRAYQREMQSIEADENDKMNYDCPDYVKKNLSFLSEFDDKLSREVALIDSCGTENTPVL